VTAEIAETGVTGVLAPPPFSAVIFCSAIAFLPIQHDIFVQCITNLLPVAYALDIR
jgi:hypothetical protein